MTFGTLSPSECLPASACPRVPSSHTGTLDRVTTCPVCADPNAYTIEQAYLEGRPVPTYSRAQVERHLAHVTDRRTLQAVTDLASASGVAARLHQLSVTAAAVMDRALAADDGRLALSALKEARVTLEAMSRLSDALAGAGAQGEARPDLDAMLSERLGGTLPPQESAPEPGPRALPVGREPSD